jgi:DNA replication protein DnaC
MSKQSLDKQLSYLNLSYTRDHLEELMLAAAQKELSNRDFFESIIANEVNAKEQRASERRIKQARFPYIKTLDDFDFNYPVKINRDLVRHLFSLGFLENHANVAFLALPGLGKTHLSIALAYHACTQGVSVRFDTAINIINKLDTAAKNGNFNQVMRTCTAPQILVIDEIGYLPIDQRGADLLFQVISSRYERGSIIFSSNRAFNEWATIFNNDKTITSAILDRVLHRCEVVLIEGTSYRMKERKTI